MLIGLLKSNSAGGRGRTVTRVASQQFLRLSRLPIPPPRLWIIFVWSGRRDSNSRPPPWQGGILPLNYFRSLVNIIAWCRGGDLNSYELSLTTPSRWRVYRIPPPRHWQGRQDLNPRPAVLETAALPTELPRHYAKNYTNYAG